MFGIVAINMMSDLTLVCLNQNACTPHTVVHWTCFD